VLLAGYSSGSKWALFGAMRQAVMVVSNEVPVTLCLVVPVMVAGTMNMVEIVQGQLGWFGTWNLFHDPFTFLAFFLFAVPALASTKRAPFDLAEAESELVAGYLTEYSGMRWAFFFFAEYAAMFVVAAVAVTLWLGGWDFGIPILPDWGWLNAIVFTSKSVILVFVMMWVRWTLPRIRIDQVMHTCLKYFIPIACFALLGAALWPLVFPRGFWRTLFG
jgi:NADH-quinone oxidoreductase subunit H